MANGGANSVMNTGGYTPQYQGKQSSSFPINPNLGGIAPPPLYSDPNLGVNPPVGSTPPPPVPGPSLPPPSVLPPPAGPITTPVLPPSPPPVTPPPVTPPPVTPPPTTNPNPGFGTGGNPNINQTSAMAINDAIAGARNEMGFQPMAINPGSYNEERAFGEGYFANTTGSTGVNAGQLSATNLSPYMNQYQTQVIDNTIGDLDRSRQLQLQNTGANASSMGAFGGSRHALREAEDNRNFFNTAANTASNLRNQGFNQAQLMAQQDIANRLRGDEFTAGAANQARFANQNAVNTAKAFSAGSRNAAALANQGARNARSQFNVGQNQASQMANQAAQMAGSSQRLSAGNQLANLGNLGFGMGQTLSSNLAQDGAMKQGINQLLIDAVKNQFNQRSQAPYQSIGLLSQALGASPVPQTSTTSKQPGLFDYLTLGASL